jgi:hypothetical protein
MKIAICGSLSFAENMGKVRDYLATKGHDVFVPFTAEKILQGEHSALEIENKKNDGSFSDLVIKNDAIRKWFEVIKNSDAILVLNYDKKGIKNYVGGNAFLEIGFAHVLNKRIFLFNSVPETSYKDEILSMEHFVLNGNLDLIL